MSTAVALLVAVCLAAWVRRRRKRRSREQPTHPSVCQPPNISAPPALTRRGFLGRGHGGRM